MSTAGKERDLVRELARKVAEITAEPYSLESIRLRMAVKSLDKKEYCQL